MTLSLEHIIDLEIPNVMLTVLGMFSISRHTLHSPLIPLSSQVWSSASSSPIAQSAGTSSCLVTEERISNKKKLTRYERYWLGRTCWSDVMRNCRSLGRLIWFHVPLRTSPKTPEETAAGTTKRSVRELNKVMAEKRMALDLVEGFAVALKHHIRG